MVNREQFDAALDALEAATHDCRDYDPVADNGARSVELEAAHERARAEVLRLFDLAANGAA